MSTGEARAGSAERPLRSPGLVVLGLAGAAVAVLAVCGLSVARLLSADRRVAAVAAASALSLALGTTGGLVGQAAGAAVAVALGAMPVAESLTETHRPPGPEG